MKLRRVVARNLRRIRQKTGLSQEELADRAGLNRNYVGMIEREENAPTVDALEQISDALNIDRCSFPRKLGGNGVAANGLVGRLPMRFIGSKSYHQANVLINQQELEKAAAKGRLSAFQETTPSRYARWHWRGRS
jgi:transcriptional regulator with XRE-family HTH domain